MKLITCFIFLLPFLTSTTSFKYKISTFDALLDHFSFVDNSTFALRYLTNDSYVRSDRSPILFYAGNEGDIELFAENTGFMWRAAEELEAEVVFAEHRYYGKSLPFGNESYKDAQHLGYLTSEQALADYADLLQQVLNKDQRRPVILFGGRLCQK
jgi:lysosomal Pro-X carboxypeptidase